MAHTYDTDGWGLAKDVDPDVAFTEFLLERLFATVNAQGANDTRENGIISGCLAAVNESTTTHYLGVGTGRVVGAFFSFAGSTVEIEDLTSGTTNYVFVSIIRTALVAYDTATSSGLLPRAHAKTTDVKNSGDIKVCEVVVDGSGYITSVDNAPGNRDYAYQHQIKRIYGTGTVTNVLVGAANARTITVDYSAQATGIGIGNIQLSTTTDDITLDNRQDLLDGENFTFDITNGGAYTTNVSYTWSALVWSV